VVKKLLITKNTQTKGNDHYRVFSVRVKESTFDALVAIAAGTSRSRNEIVNLLLEFGLENIEIASGDHSAFPVSE
jgi:hypothetical protein